MYDSYLLEDIGNLDEGILGEVDECGDAENVDNTPINDPKIHDD